MGFDMRWNSWQLLRDLTSPDPRARNLLEPFRLFVVPLYDPAVHVDLAAAFSRDFARLDRLTGQNLLFLAPVDAPESWRRLALKRPYHVGLSELEVRIDEGPDSDDPGLTVASLAAELRVPADQLPCLVVTNDLCSRRLRWFRTCARHLQDQLDHLASVADEAESRTAALEMIVPWKMVLCGYAGEENLPDNVAGALATLVSYIQAGDMRSPPNVRAQARKAATRHMAGLLRTWASFKNRPPTGDDDGLVNLSLDIIRYTAHYLKVVTPDIREELGVDPECLEPQNRATLRSALRVMKVLEDDPSAMQDMLATDNLWDHSPGVIAFGKAFEGEVNLSIGHWIRRALGVRLPEHFNIKQRNLRAIVNVESSGNSFEVDFNRGRSGPRRSRSWHPPGLGETLLAAKALGGVPERWDPAAWETTLLEWDKIASLRNNAGHPGIVHAERVSAMMEHIRALGEAGIFRKMADLRDGLRHPDARLRT